MSYLGREPSQSPLVSSDLPDNAVTLAKIAPGADGSLITYSASQDPELVPPGTSGHVLTSRGDASTPTFQAVAAWTSFSAVTTSGTTTYMGGAGDIIGAHHVIHVLLTNIRDDSTGDLELKPGFNNGSTTVFTGHSHTTASYSHTSGTPPAPALATSTNPFIMDRGTSGHIITGHWTFFKTLGNIYNVSAYYFCGGQDKFTHLEGFYKNDSDAVITNFELNPAGTFNLGQWGVLWS